MTLRFPPEVSSTSAGVSLFVWKCSTPLESHFHVREYHAHFDSSNVLPEAYSVFLSFGRLLLSGLLSLGFFSWVTVDLVHQIDHEACVINICLALAGDRVKVVCM